MLESVAPWPTYSTDVAIRVSELIARGKVFDYSGEPPVTELEQRFSSLHDGAYAVSLNSGTSALFAAFVGLGIVAGDEVIVPNLTFLASGSPLLWLNATLVLADSAANEPSIGLDAITSAITPKTRAVVVTHLFGNPADVEAIADLCRLHDIKMIEDCSHAHASVVDSRHVGTFGDAAIYSIGAAKLVSGGHGGILVTRNEVVRDIALLLGHFKPRTRRDILTPELRRYAEFALGGNLRISPLSAALALDHITRLADLSDARRANVDVLNEAFQDLLDPVSTPHPRANGTHYDIVYRLPKSIRTEHREQFLQELCARGVPVSAPSTRPLNRVLLKTLRPVPIGADDTLLHRLEVFAKDAPTDDCVPNSTEQHDRMISFPAGRLYRLDLRAARWVAEQARPVLERLVKQWME